MSHPNLLLIMTDQQRFDTIAALGNPLILTPALDRLAREGTAFTRTYTPSPVCVPARCSLLTGLPPHRTGCFDNAPMNLELTSMMQVLAGAGYQTHGVGKMHFFPDATYLWGFESRDIGEEEAPDDDFKRHVRSEGYDHVYDFNGVRGEMYYVPQISQLPARLHNTTWTADRSIDFLDRRDRQRPFFLWTSFIRPHPPFDPPTPWNKLYRGPEMPLPQRPESVEHLYTFWNRLQNRYKYRDQGIDDNLIRIMRAYYYASISFIDHNVGRILARLEVDGELDRTMIVFISDHGEFLGDYNCFGKRSMMDVASRVPCLVRFPDAFPAGAACDTPTSLLDVMPTFLAAAGLGTTDCAGEPLDRVVVGDTARQVVFAQLSQGRAGLYMAVTRDLKYVYSAADDREFLFDLRLDPDETRNRAENPLYRAKRDEMRRTLVGYFTDEGYLEPLDGENWKKHPPTTVPVDHPDAWLLFQDPPDSVHPIPGYERDRS